MSTSYDQYEYIVIHLAVLFIYLIYMQTTDWRIADESP